MTPEPVAAALLHNRTTTAWVVKTATLAVLKSPEVQTADFRGGLRAGVKSRRTVPQAPARSSV
ncbi:hypothetical protein MES5069_520101 [Mesorhizobium escarrei]|uniref:Uncharacterized protein n=1 Tax=Mesorhizobium escarrei TaxID=666018 RepID=A0ABM9EC61_9HYPH|nr:hypothetical protein MES5069_520101 [Mesorhizobium escarrei]